MKKKVFQIGDSSVGKRLDVFLAEETEMTRSFVQKAIKSGDVRVNGQKAKPHYSLRDGDEVEFEETEVRDSGLEPEDIDLDVIYEDKDVIIVNKPAGMVVHPTDSGHNQTGTLVNALLYHCKDLSGIGGVMRPGIVHRLDKGTSGVLVVAKNDKAHQDLSGQIKDRKVKKVYVTLVKGRLEPETGTIEAPVGRSLMDRKKMAVTEHGSSRSALTHYKVLKYLSPDGALVGGASGVHKSTYSLVEVEIVTGRTHQIRVHFQAIGFPVVGDDTYGDAKTNVQFKKFGLKRPFLHAKKLGLSLPSSGEWQEFKAGLAGDLEKVLSGLEA